MKESSRNAGEIQKREITKSALGTGRQTLHQDVETDEELHGWGSTNTRPIVKLIVPSGGDAVNWTLKLTQLQISPSVEFLLVIGMGSNTSSPETAGGPGAGMQLAWGPVRHPRGQEERESSSLLANSLYLSSLPPLDSSVR